MAKEPKLIPLPVGKSVSLWKGAGYSPQLLGSITVRAICPRQDGLIDVFFCWESDKPLSSEWIGGRRFMLKTKGGPDRLYVMSRLRETNISEDKVLILQPVS